MGMIFLNQDMKATSFKKADTNKSNGNAHWWRTTEKKDLNAMDVDALKMEERESLMRQGKFFRCKKKGHLAEDCLPLEQGEGLKQKKVDLARFAYTTIKVLTKEQKEAFTKLVMEGGDEDFWRGELGQRQFLLVFPLNMYK
jgi:hypothetical protein